MISSYRYFLFTLILLCICSCSIGTSFKVNQIQSFKGVLIPDLSDEPILIERVSKDLIVKEAKKFL